MRPIIVLKTNDETIAVSCFFSSAYRPDKPPDELPPRLKIARAHQPCFQKSSPQETKKGEPTPSSAPTFLEPAPCSFYVTDAGSRSRDLFTVS
jgi:hypothetical protein